MVLCGHDDRPLFLPILTSMEQKPTLAETIKYSYDEPLSDAEAQEASRNLVGFFSLLLEIDQQQKQGRNDASHGSQHHLHKAER